MGPALPGVIAGGNISPARIVLMSTEHTVTQATAASTEPFGISGGGVRYAPGTPWDNGYAATVGQSCPVYQNGEVCEIEAGAAFSGGDWIKADANGRGITATTGTYHVGQAQEAATVSGQRIPIKVHTGYKA